MLAKNPIGIIGIVLALTAVGMAIFKDHLRPPPPPPGTQLTDVAVSKGAGLLGVKVEQEPAIDWATGLQFALGFLGIACGAISWVRRENHRVSSVAASLGLVAVAWEYVLYAVGIAVVLLMLGSFS